MIYSIAPLSSSRMRGPILNLTADLTKCSYCSNAEMDLRLRGDDGGLRKISVDHSEKLMGFLPVIATVAGHF